MKVKDCGEFELIKMIDQPIFQANMVHQGIGDDCAVLPFNEQYYQLITCDLLVEGVHFLAEKISFFQLGYKAVAASLSDIAAMGGEPTNILVAIAIPEYLMVAQWQEIYQGIGSICERYRINLIGGDTTSSPQGLVINITAMGLVEKNCLRLRSQGKIGDKIFVTGALGASKAGLALILNDHLTVDDQTREYLLAKHCQPEPCCFEVAVLNRLCKGHLHSLNDISDGLISECYEIANASGVGMMINYDDIPIDQHGKGIAKQLNEDIVQWAITSGEEYQLVGSIAAHVFDDIATQYQKLMGKPLYCIGEVVAEKGVFLVRGQQSQRVLYKGYEHFDP